MSQQFELASKQVEADKRSLAEARANLQKAIALRLADSHTHTEPAEAAAHTQAFDQANNNIGMYSGELEWTLPAELEKWKARLQTNRQVYEQLCRDPPHDSRKSSGEAAAEIPARPANAP